MCHFLLYIFFFSFLWGIFFCKTFWRSDQYISIIVIHYGWESWDLDYYIFFILVLSCRFFFVMKSLDSNDDKMDLETGKPGKERERIIRIHKGIGIPNKALVSGLAYCVSSCSMILVNKYVLSSYDFNAGISLMLYQVKFTCHDVLTFGFEYGYQFHNTD